MHGLATLFSLSVGATTLALGSSSTYRNIVYFKEWGTYSQEGDFHMFDLDWSRVTHVKYGFAVPQANGTVTLADKYAAIIRNYVDPTTSPDVARGSFGLANTIKKQFRTTKFGLSIGGDNNSVNFSAVAASAAARQAFAASAVALLQNLGLDFIDVYWASPVEGGNIPHSPNDMQNFVLLLQEVKVQLTTLPFPTELSAVAPADQRYARNWDKSLVCSIVDHVHITTYNLAQTRVLDPFENGRRRLASATVTDHEANLYADPANPSGSTSSVDSAIQHYLNGGCPAQKIVMGIPSFGRSFDNTQGLYTNFTAPTTGSWVYQGTGQGVWDYKSLPRGAATEVYDPKLGATYSYDPTTLTFTSYDGPHSVSAKLDYIKKYGLGGTMFWSADSDALSTSTRSLISQAYNYYGATNMAFFNNTVDYPNSSYVNIRTPPSTTVAPTPAPTGDTCAGNHGVCFWPLTQQVVVNWSQDDCSKHTNVFVWCP
ncbi:Aste57867_533 [Aphanomyces stellatus]|uniref:Aste57867_533 protein n=1 Tax=Aphanomyces stellatus TaxID=120398 RepID=A0A485K378_9STRA|nr:hypothetical protein As57867_000532 [Aphanomyces stellatus]VFT77758.1 Aste57867_533 [Aphanomyces stellatus]